MTFGEFVRNKRLEINLSLREFCRKANLDSSNWSKVERDKIPAFGPQDSLKKIAVLLQIKKDSSDWTTFFDLVSISQKKIPDDVFSDSKVVEILPVFFRTIRGEKLNSKEMSKLYSLLKKR